MPGGLTPVSDIDISAPNAAGANAYFAWEMDTASATTRGSLDDGLKEEG
jgi:hypothetical protein